MSFNKSNEQVSLLYVLWNHPDILYMFKIVQSRTVSGKSHSEENYLNKLAVRIYQELVSDIGIFIFPNIILQSRLTVDSFQERIHVNGTLRYATFHSIVPHFCRSFK